MLIQWKLNNCPFSNYKIKSFITKYKNGNSLQIPKFWFLDSLLFLNLTLTTWICSCREFSHKTLHSFDSLAFPFFIPLHFLRFSWNNFHFHKYLHHAKENFKRTKFHLLFNYSNGHKIFPSSRCTQYFSIYTFIRITNFSPFHWKQRKRITSWAS